MLWSAKRSVSLEHEKTPFRFTQPPSPVDTVTSGEIVIIRSERPSFSRDNSKRIFPKAAWLDISRPPGGTTFGTFISVDFSHRRPLEKKGRVLRKNEMWGASSMVANGSHSRPRATPIFSLPLNHLFVGHQPRMIIFMTC